MASLTYESCQYFVSLKKAKIRGEKTHKPQEYEFVGAQLLQIIFRGRK